MPTISPIALNAIITALLIGRAASQCTVDGVISSFKGECNRANFEANLQGCTISQLFTNPNEEIAELCEYDAPVQFVEINGFYQLDRRYFNGGGPLIDSLEAFSIESGRILRFDSTSGDNTLIAWPEYAALLEYNKNVLGIGDHGYPPHFDIVNSCDLKTAMCCFIDDEGGTGFDRDSVADVCRHDLADSSRANHIKAGWSVFPGSETPTHCVGFTWEDGENSDIFKGNALFDISLRTTATKGYYKSIPGAPTCGCVEHMPKVTKADCRTVTGGDITYVFEYDTETGTVAASNKVDVTYADCPNDLAAHYKSVHGNNDIDAHIVGSCDTDVPEYMNKVQFLINGNHPTKYMDITEADGWTLVAGEGVRFWPPGTDPEAADANFRALVNGGCKDASGNPRYCVIRRFCDSCSEESHRDIYYQRKTEIPSFDELYFLDLFLNNWFSAPANLLHEDFELYSTYEDALAGTRPWQYCNYDVARVGFPRDCNDANHGQGNQWNSYVRSGATANHHAFYVEKP